MAKEAWQLRPGDQVVYIDMKRRIFTKLRVKNIEWAPESYDFILVTYAVNETRPVPGRRRKFVHTGPLEIQEFSPLQEVVYPRRPKGVVKFWDTPEVLVEELAIGDIVPPRFGLLSDPDDETGLSKTTEGCFEVLQIWPYYSKSQSRQVGWRIQVKNALGHAEVKYVPLVDPYFHSPQSVLLPPDIDPVTMEPFKKKKKYQPGTGANTSGLYKHRISGEQKSFLLENKRGRPPFGSAPAPVDSQWEYWEHVAGDRHPKEIMYSKRKEQDKGE